MQKEIKSSYAFNSKNNTPTMFPVNATNTAVAHDNILQ
jgi:hypothetical protein